MSSNNVEKLDLNEDILKLSLCLYNIPGVARNGVQMIINEFSNFISESFIPSLEKQMNSNIDLTVDESTKQMQKILQKNRRPFEPISTEYKRFKLYGKTGYFHLPQDFIIGHTSVEKNQSGLVITELDEVNAVYIPLKSTLKLFFESPGVFNEIQNYISFLKRNPVILSNFMQGELWKNIESSHTGKQLLPLFLFFDDFECGNALGSHAGRNKLGALYASIPCLPPHMVSHLSSIFLVSLFYSCDRKIFGNQSIFKILIDELNSLKTDGITLNINNVRHHVFFQCALILGDNLGLNSTFGFVESFSALRSCRICLADSSKSKKMIYEDENLLRTMKNYDNDVKTNDTKKTGIKESCVFNKIDGFHVTNNQSVDIMHDVFEGVANYVITAVLKQLIYVDELFSFDILNSRINLFNYSPLEKPNMPLPISADYIKSNNRLKMSAAEMMCFSRYLGLMIGDLVPRTNKAWKLYLKLRQIIAIITSPRLLRSYSKILENLIAEHNSLYIELFGDLKPKFHLLVHYARLLLQNGPFIYYWSMRYESKNRELRIRATTTTSKKNLLKTIAIRNQLLLCYSAYCSDKIVNKIIYGPIQSCSESEFAYFPNVSSKNIKSFKHIIFYSKQLTAGSIILTNIDENDGPAFGKILGIFQVNEKLFFVMYSLMPISFDEHYYAYNVKISNKEILIKYIEDVPKMVPCLLIKKINQWYVATRHAI